MLTHGFNSPVGKMLPTFSPMRRGVALFNGKRCVQQQHPCFAHDSKKP